jgi:hypothetical protein
MVSHKLGLAEVLKGYEALDGNYRLEEETVVKIAIQAHQA